MASKGVGPVVASQNYVQTPIILNAKDILPQGLLQGKNYKVEGKVRNDGLINMYHLSTNYGPLAVEGTKVEDRADPRVNDGRADIFQERIQTCFELPRSCLEAYDASEFMV